MSRCGFFLSHLDSSTRRQLRNKSWDFVFHFPRRGLKYKIEAQLPTESHRLRNFSFVYFRRKFCLGIWFCGNLSSHFLLRITKIESKIVETMLWTSKLWTRRIFKSIEWKKKKKYVRMKSGKKKIGKILWGIPPKATQARVAKEGNFPWNIVYYTCTDRQAKIFFASGKLHSGGF